VSFCTRLTTAGFALLTALVAACGTLTAPISFSSADKSVGDPPSPGGTSITITPVEGRPRGLLLAIDAPSDLAEDGELEVVRRTDDGQPETVRTIELGTRRLEQLADDGLQFLDRSVITDNTYHYQVVYHPPTREPSGREDRTTTSPSRSVSIHWRSPPSRPNRLTARQIGQAIELQWSPRKQSAVIFRRNVLDDREGARRIATVGPGARGRFVDRTAKPDEVYAYQIALAREYAQFPQFGPPSDPLYVSLE